MLNQILVHEEKTMATGSISTLQVPSYGKIQSMSLIFKTAAGAPVTEAQLRAEVGNVRLTINGRDVVNAPVSDLLDAYESLGSRVGVAAGIGGTVELNVGRLLFVDPLLRDVFGFGTADVANIQVQVTAGTLTNVATVQVVTGRSPQSQNLGTHCRFIQYPQSFNATGDHTVDTLPRDEDSAYLACYVSDGASGTITFGECRVNSQTIFERVPNAINQQILSNRGFVQTGGYFIYMFNDGSESGRLPMLGVTDFRLITTFSVAPGAAGYNINALTLNGIKIAK